MATILLDLLVYASEALAAVFCTLCLASGLYYLAEVVEVRSFIIRNGIFLFWGRNTQ
jgi:hypothetical protein